MIQTERHEDERLLDGRAAYVADLELPGSLTAHFVRSPFAHASINAIDASAFSSTSNVQVFTADDLESINQPLPMMVPIPEPQQSVTQRPLARERVCYVGEPVAVVLVENRYLAEDAEEEIYVDYDPLPVVGDPLEALKFSEEVIHPQCNTNEVGSWRMTKGDWSEAAAAADVKVSLDLDIARSAGHPIETRGVLAHFDGIERVLTVYSSTQVPHKVRMLLAQILDMGEDEIRVIAPEVGGGFGSKLCLYPEEVACSYLALKTGRPVKWIEDRREHFLTTAHGRGQHHAIELALQQDGTVVGLRDQFVHDNGAYSAYGIRVPLVTAKALIGPYSIPNFDVEFRSAFTNRAPVIPYRGAGQPEAVFALERALDKAARALRIEPSEVRRRNLIPREALPYDTGLVYPGLGPVVYDSGDFAATLNKALDVVDLNHFRKEQEEARSRGRYLGLGIACYVEETGTGAFEGATVLVDARGYVRVIAGVCSQGQGHETMLAEVCADVLDIGSGRVTVQLGDTSDLRYGIGTWGSRAAVMAGSAVAGAAEQVRKKAVSVAAQCLEISEQDLVWVKGGAEVVGSPHRRMELSELVQASRVERGRLPEDAPGLDATYYFKPEGITYANGVHIAIIEVYPMTREVKVKQYFVCHDCGRLIKPSLVEGQMFGGVVQGLGGALYEELSYDEEGQLLTASFMDYLIPTLSETPPVHVYHLETHSPLNPLGAKGAGEGGAIPGYAAIAGAVEDALSHAGIEIREVPISPNRLHDLLESASRVEKLSTGSLLLPP